MSGTEHLGSRMNDARPSVPVGARQRLADALRVTIDATVSARLDDERVAEAAELVEALNRRLTSASRSGHSGFRLGPSETQRYFPTSPVIGLCNPLAPPVRLTVVDSVDGGFPHIAGSANFGYAYEGPPTCVHGGVIAEMFDEVLGAANLAAGNPGMTGSLTIDYRKPTPLRTELRIEARCQRREGRKIYSWGAIYHGDTLTAEADGLFIEVAPTSLAAIAEGNLRVVDQPGSTDHPR